MNTKPTHSALVAALAKIITAPIEWSIITANIRAEFKVRKNGWMQVRGALQELINQKKIARTDSVQDEVYYAL
jgi:hypothetical protein